LEGALFGQFGFRVPRNLISFLDEKSRAEPILKAQAGRGPVEAMDRVPDIRDVLDAKKTISPYLANTPLRQSPTLSREFDAEVYFKYENYLPTGSFKVRGGINLLSSVSRDERIRTVVTASTGNHAQSIAYASKLFGIQAIVIMPVNANPLKVEATRSYGAEVIFHGKDFDESREFAERKASESGYRYVHSANEPLLISGVATLALEIFEDLPEVDVIVSPVGGGSGASGSCIVSKALSPRTSVVGVQSESAPAQYKSWKTGTLVSDKMETFAEGLATRVGFELTQKILGDGLDDFVLVSDEEIKSAMIKMIDAAHTIVEAAGASPLAAAYKIRNRLKGKRAVLILSGGNITLGQLRELLLREQPLQTG
jgi:threonine dehydratase